MVTTCIAIQGRVILEKSRFFVFPSLGRQYFIVHSLRAKFCPILPRENTEYSVYCSTGKYTCPKWHYQKRVTFQYITLRNYILIYHCRFETDFLVSFILFGIKTNVYPRITYLVL